jgi:hypothetical protein
MEHLYVAGACLLWAVSVYTVVYTLLLIKKNLNGGA